MKPKRKRNDPTEYSRDAFLHNPVASPNEATGYVVTIPETGDEAEAVSDLYNVPVESLEGNEEPKSKPR